MKIPISEYTEQTSVKPVTFSHANHHESTTAVSADPHPSNQTKNHTLINRPSTTKTRRATSINRIGYRCPRATAEELLDWAASQHGGGWVGHSRTAARVAETIAKYCDNNTISNPQTLTVTTNPQNLATVTTNPQNPTITINTPNNSTTTSTHDTVNIDQPLDPERAYVYALLHDIGRYEGNTMLHHIVAGYKLLMRIGYQAEARICLTHSCYSTKLAKNPAYWPGIDDPTELRFLVNFINTVHFNDYDRLIQLADLMSLEAGVFSINDRFCDSVSRYHLSDPQEDLRARQALKTYFDQKTGLNIYSLFADEISRHALNQP